MARQKKNSETKKRSCYARLICIVSSQREQTFSYHAIKMNKNFMVPLINFVYNGQSTDGLPNGYGEAMKFNNGSLFAKYYGYWRNGHPHTYGILEASADTIYRGSWYKGLWSNGFTIGSTSEYKYPGGNTIFKGTHLNHITFMKM